jgi:cyclic beta-1,2-glucan synthetase
LDAGAGLTRTTGAVLDPVFALRARLVIQPQQTATLAFSTAIAGSREEALALADQFHELRVVQRAFEMAWAYSQVELRHLHLAPASAHLFQRLASALLYPDPAWRADPQTLAANRQGQNGLWRYGISGDLPILVARLTRQDQIELVRELLAAHQYWRSHGLVADIVIINDHPGSYLDSLQEQLAALIEEVHRHPEGQAGHVFLLRGAQLQREDQILLAAAAHVVLRAEIGSLAKQMEWAASRAAHGPQRPMQRRRPPAATVGQTASSPLAPSRPDRLADSSGRTLFNGWGGFTDDARAYQIELRGGRRTPQPWSNVIANPRCGCLVTESGGGYTWAENSREMKLTTWTNDPITDLPSEWLYVRDEASGAVYRPLPQPGRDADADYVVEHRPGESRFLLTQHQLEFETRIAVAADDPVKFVCAKVRNTSRHARTLALTYYVEWVLGVHRRDTQVHLVTSIEPNGAIFARNHYHPEFPNHVALLNVLGSDRSSTGDRAELVGRNGDAIEPAGLSGSSLSGRTGAGLDPCGAVQAKLVLAPGQRGEVVFLLGAGRNLDEAREILARYRSPADIDKEIDRQIGRWDDTLSQIQVRTPNAALDTLVNGWLIYQTLSCRLWARSAYYQAGGAYGFRDQLQDVTALVYCRPDLAREHLLRCAARQFEEGDVQHWWHPPNGRGTRTRFSDDYLWLPLSACHYVRVTGDRAVWDEPAPLLSSPVLEPHEHERYEQPQQSPRWLTLYEHCRLMFDRAFRLGPHGLPLIGCGDWNDGMNKVGALGQGESVWVGWFLRVILGEFLPVMRERGDLAAADRLAALSAQLLQNLETHAWDGQWYRRAFYDDGTPLGSQQSDECRIDSISQSWSVFAGANRQRSRLAMEAVWNELVRERARLVLLLTPPFDKTDRDPGYIKGYLPGIRENGGQYTHAALWTVRAFAQLGDSERAMELLDLINPVLHTDSPEGVMRYQVEPYVAAADVYGVAPHTGRGGWTWYTGSAAWMYRVALESILGFDLRGQRLRLRPCIPDDWPEFELTFRRGAASYRFTFRNGPHRDTPHVMLDGESLTDDEVIVVDDAQQHEVLIDCSATAQRGRRASADGMDRSAASRVR